MTSVKKASISRQNSYHCRFSGFTVFHSQLIFWILKLPSKKRRERRKQRCEFLSNEPCLFCKRAYFFSWKIDDSLWITGERICQRWRYCQTYLSWIHRWNGQVSAKWIEDKTENMLESFWKKWLQMEVLGILSRNSIQSSCRGTCFNPAFVSFFYFTLAS